MPRTYRAPFPSKSGLDRTRAVLRARNKGLSPTKVVISVLSAAFGVWIFVWYWYYVSVIDSERESDTSAIKAVPDSDTLAFEPKFEKTHVLKIFSKANCESDSLVREVKDSAEITNLCQKEGRQGVGEYASLRLDGPDDSRIVEIGTSCHSANAYAASLFRLDGCVNVHHYPRLASVWFADSRMHLNQISDKELKSQWRAQLHKPDTPSDGTPRVRIVFSCESSEYFGYQVWANYYGYLSSKQSSASWTRLLTARERDDLADHIPGLATFQAPRHFYARRYSPINKPDVIDKWLRSADAPREEIILVIDPDNWLLKDVAPWTNRASKNHALGEAAYYYGSKTAQRLWKELCLKNCDREMDLVGVPYIVHRDDLRVIAPLWKMYTLMIKERMERSHPNSEEFQRKYKSLDVSWAAEMYGYNMASAHAGVKHDVIRRMQVRDVSSERRKSKLESVAMIHVGRAWFPNDYAPAQRWAHTEGKSFRRYGTQVWCKCNNTASTIMPWPVPEAADFQSTKTLEILHYSKELLGPIPANTKFRSGGPKRYSTSVP